MSSAHDKTVALFASKGPCVCDFFLLIMDNKGVAENLSKILQCKIKVPTVLSRRSLTLQFRTAVEPSWAVMLDAASSSKNGSGSVVTSSAPGDSSVLASAASWSS